MGVIDKRGLSEAEIAEIEGLIEHVADRRGSIIFNTSAEHPRDSLKYEPNRSALPDLEADLRAAIQKFPDNIDVHVWCAMIMKDQGRVEDSISHMRSEAQKRPDDPEWQIAHATAYLGSGLPKGRFNTVAAEVFRMPLTNEQKDRLNQFWAAVNEPPRKIRPPRVVQYIDQKLGDGLKWLFGLDRE